MTYSRGAQNMAKVQLLTLTQLLFSTVSQPHSGADEVSQLAFPTLYIVKKILE